MPINRIAVAGNASTHLRQFNEHGSQREMVELQVKAAQTQGGATGTEQGKAEEETIHNTEGFTTHRVGTETVIGGRRPLQHERACLIVKYITRR
jgi:hypothetical protein